MQAQTDSGHRNFGGFRPTKPIYLLIFLPPISLLKKLFRVELTSAKHQTPIQARNASWWPFGGRFELVSFTRSSLK